MASGRSTKLSRRNVLTALIALSFIFIFTSLTLLKLIDQIPIGQISPVRRSEVKNFKSGSKSQSFSGDISQDIDAVYTWVNGSDPDFLKELQKTRLEYLMKYNPQAKCSIRRSCSSKDDKFMFIRTPLMMIRSDLNYSTSLRRVRYQSVNMSEHERLVVFRDDDPKNHLNEADTLHEQGVLNATYIMINCTTQSPVRRDDGLSRWVTVKNLIFVSSSNLAIDLEQVMYGKVDQNIRLMVDVKVVMGSKNLAILLVKPKWANQINFIYTTLTQSLHNRSDVSITWPVPLVSDDLSACLLSNTDLDLDVSPNRFADNDELRFSLRSLEMYAPWIRNIYLVTNGQIPYWLNISNPRIKIIKHTEIFPHKNDLPTFNSAAIECHLHRIHGLSENFLYFNDDFFLGKPTFLNDFHNSREGYKIRLAWPVPNCAPNCPSAWIKDSFCDVACNTSLCLFDGGDCSGVQRKDEHIRWHPGNQFNSGIIRNRLVSPSGVVRIFNCAPGCADSWLGDHFCDSSCNNFDCGYDVGDCSLKDYHNLIKIESLPWVTDYMVRPTKVFYLKLTNFICPPSNIHYVKFERGKKIRTAILSSKHEVLTVILHANESNTKLNLEIKCNLGDNSTILPLNFIMGPDLHLNQKFRESYFINDGALGSKEINMNDISNSYSEPYTYSYTKDHNPSRPSSLESSWALENPSSSSSSAFQELSSISTPLSGLDSQGIFRHEKDRDLQKIGNMISNHEKYGPKGSHGGRHLLDTFSDSIVYVNYLYNKVYGVKNRKVPAHAPYFLNKHIIRQLWAKFSQELSITSSHRIRSQTDMQFPFSYFYFLMNDNVTIDAMEFIRKFDTDNSRTLSPIELRAFLIHKSTMERDPVVLVDSGSMWINWSYCPEISNPPSQPIDLSFDFLLNCSHIMNITTSSLTILRNKFTPLLDDKDTRFLMIHPKIDRFTKDINAILKDVPQILCMNDDISGGNETEIRKIRHIQQAFYEYLYPKASSFEIIDSYPVIKTCNQDSPEIEFEVSNFAFNDLFFPIHDAKLAFYTLTCFLLSILIVFLIFVGLFMLNNPADHQMTRVHNFFIFRKHNYHKVNIRQTWQ